MPMVKFQRFCKYCGKRSWVYDFKRYKVNPR